MTSVVFILIAAGAIFSWTISYAQVPQAIIATAGLDGAGPVKMLIAVNVAFFVGCMFVDSIVVTLILVPIFAAMIAAAKLAPVLVGVIVTMQVVIGAATPPFVANLFTAIAVFRRPFLEVDRGVPIFILILLFVTLLTMVLPPIARSPRDLAFH